ncbi:MAG: hypothetical protein ACI9C1_003408 [Candidatus Aldehydirespiratoraceae bacterium]
MSVLEPIETYLRPAEVLDPDAALVIRGWPLTVDGLLRNADATRRRYSLHGDPLIAVSAEATMPEWNVESILSGARLRTRRSYASTLAHDVIESGFGLLPTFSAPHYSIVLANYTEEEAQRLISVLGDIRPNPYHVRRES